MWLVVESVGVGDLEGFGVEDTLPETNSSHLKMRVSNRNLLFQGGIFRCHLSFREGI